MVATGVSNQYYYGYSFNVDGGSYSSPTNVGFPSLSSFAELFGAYLSEGSHTIGVRLLIHDQYGFWQIVATASTGITLTQRYNVIVQNSYGAGNIIADGTQYPSGTTFTWNSSSSHTLQAIDGQSFGGYVQRFDSWSGIGSSSSISINISNNATYTANFLKEFNVGFQNNLPGASGGSINVNGTQYSAPTSSFTVRQQSTITGGALYQVINGVEYTFSSWSNGGTSASTTFTPSDHTTYTANFNAKPLPPPSVSAGGAVGSPVQITWSDAGLNSGITQFQIWRMAKPLGGSQGSPQLIATVSRGTTSYTDYDYTVTSTYSNDLLNYDVRSYFSTNGTYSDPSYVPVFGRIGAGQVQDGELAINLGELPTEYRVGNFPNPFNPSTTISYQLVEDANVTLEIYDVMGRKISSLLQEQKQAGYYTAKWEGKDNSGRQVATGMYLYRFTAAPTSGKQPFTKSGKLLLTK
ncbi:MAG: T9SS type A sorting domain-containing protein [Ignavibacteriales bacterium]|nr:T9SS type A sorting domain-containing protein [Ignavibacteriales bacterium]